MDTDLAKVGEHKLGDPIVASKSNLANLAKLLHMMKNLASPSMKFWPHKFVMLHLNIFSPYRPVAQ